MKFIADLHIHSYLSRATARNLNLEHLNLWAQLKGIKVVGTGDFTHPKWFAEIQEKLEPAEPGLFKLRSELENRVAREVPSTCKTSVRFLLSVEISSIYKKNGKVRKVHNLVFAPDIQTAEKINTRLARIGNIRSDGRPILGLDSRSLLETVLEISEDVVLIPAHIWTPWFSVLGSKSGFDCLEECFEDLILHVFAVETGLSSDPAMNWRVSSLDGLTLVSNSDAHSPSNLGREANLFDTEISYFAIVDALRTGHPDHFLGTIEFFPEEGKYHFDGHRKCGIRLSPRETMDYQGLCPVCGKPLTIGVMYRVEELADRKEGQKPERVHPFSSLLPLTDILAEVLGCGSKSKKVKNLYHQLLKTLGPELDILRSCPLDEIETKISPLLAEAVRKMRALDVHIDPGYDGEFGKVHLFTGEELARFSKQRSLFQVPGETLSPLFQKRARGDFKGGDPLSPPFKRGDTGRFPDERYSPPAPSLLSELGPPTREGVLFSSPDAWQDSENSLLADLNLTQREAVRHTGSPLLIVAGPGTGKTRTITYRIAYLLSRNIARPKQILAVTFTNKAAEEMQDRLASLIKDSDVLTGLTIKTFHALCLDILEKDGKTAGMNKAPFNILTDVDRKYLIKSLLPSDQDWARIGEAISKAKQNLLSPGEDCRCLGLSISPDLWTRIYELYQHTLHESHLLDFEDLIFKVVRLLEGHDPIRKKYQERFRFISIDEYQDVNYAQYRLIRLLAPLNHDLCVIGDPDQAIYGFRGSDTRYFYKFQQDYPAAKVLRLHQNYRSTEVIIQASRQVIGAGPDQTRLWSGIHGERWLTIAQLPTEKAEAEFVVKTIETEIQGISHFSIESRKIDTAESGDERSFSDFAVLYRINEQGKTLEEAFIRSGIPFQRVGKGKLSERKGIAELLFCLRRLESEAEKLNQVEFLRFSNRKRFQDIKMDLYALRKGLKEKTVRGKIEQLLEKINLLRELSREKEFQESARYLLSLSDSFGDHVSAFLAHLALQSEVDLYDPRAEKVTLMTIHAAKGLEFPVVFVIGCEEGLIPYHKKGEPPHISEERRLFYVGMTRAQEKLFLSWVKKRVLFGIRSSPQISPFLKDIKQDLMRYQASYYSYRKPIAIEKKIQLNLFDKDQGDKPSA